MNPPLGVRRVIHRKGRTPYTRTEELMCPCCGHLTRVEWEQPALLSNNPPVIQTHCERPACAGYFMTLSVESFFERYGQTELQSKDN